MPILACLPVKIKMLWSRTDTYCSKLVQRKELKTVVICDFQNPDIPHDTALVKPLYAATSTACDEVKTKQKNRGSCRIMNF